MIQVQFILLLCAAGFSAKAMSDLMLLHIKMIPTAVRCPDFKFGQKKKKKKAVCADLCGL